MKIKITDGEKREYIVEHDDKKSIFAIVANSINRYIHIDCIDMQSGRTRYDRRERIGKSDYYREFSHEVSYRSYQRSPENLGKVYNDEVTAYKHTIELAEHLKEIVENAGYAYRDSGEEIKKPELEVSFVPCDAPEQKAYVTKLKKRLASI